MKKETTSDLVFAGYRVWNKPESDYARITLFLEEDDGFPLQVYSNYFKTRVLPSMVVKKSDLEAYQQSLDSLHGCTVEVLYNEYGQIKEVRSC